MSSTRTYSANPWNGYSNINKEKLKSERWFRSGEQDETRTSLGQKDTKSGKAHLIVIGQAFDWESRTGEKLTLNLLCGFGGEGGIRTPVTLPGKLDFEISPDRQHRQPQTRISREETALPYPRFCQFMYASVSSPFTKLHSREKLIQSSRQLRKALRIFKLRLISNQVHRFNLLRLQMF